jgi:hypothetical protein
MIPATTHKGIPSGILCATKISRLEFQMKTFFLLVVLFFSFQADSYGQEKPTWSDVKKLGALANRVHETSQKVRGLQLNFVAVKDDLHKGLSGGLSQEAKQEAKGQALPLALDAAKSNGSTLIVLIKNRKFEAWRIKADSKGGQGRFNF